jgi:Ca2+-transporting ATPase
MLTGSVLDGLAVFGGCALVYVLARRAGVGDGGVAALTFASVVAGNLGLIALHRGSSWRRALHASNPAFWSVVAIAAGALTLSLYVPAIRHLFRFDTPPWPGVLAAVCAPWAAGAAARVLARLGGLALPARAGSPRRGDA